MNTVPRLAALLLLLASAGALAGPKDEVKAALDKFLAARSYHVTMTHSGAQAMTTEADFVAPDRFRMKMPMGTQYIIGDTMYMDVQGRSMKVPMGKGTMTQWRDPANLAKHEATMTVKALGSEAVGGKPAKKYETTNTRPQPSTSTMWVGSDGYPLQIQVSSSVQDKPVTTTIRYSRFNDPAIRVDPPE